MSESAFTHLSSLWKALHGEPPPIVADPGLTVRVLVDSLPQVEPYALDRTTEPDLSEPCPRLLR